MTRRLLLFALLSAVSCAHASTKLHVASPDWRDQVIYFVMIDRFDDGDPTNDDQHAGEFDPHDGAKFSGGDLRGVARRVGYIKELGATALWITPPVANQWWSERSRYGGYHGYWASDFSRVDAHFGTLDDYRALSSALHESGTYLIQDVVVNHVGDFFHTDGDRFERYGAPAQAPFDQNDARDPAQRARGIYHWTPEITDYSDARQVLEYQLAGLDDLDTENADVRRALRETYGRWIEDVGVDGFRVDTAFYVPREFFADFLHADDGIERVAARTGRKRFLSFGEGFAIDAAFSDVQARRIETYARDDLLDGMLNFPLYGSSLDVFARGRPTAVLAHRIRSMMAVHARPHLMPSFVDNHDVDRFLAGGSVEGLQQALLAILTLPGIPTIYYGTEQGFREQRASMFAGGYGSGGRDHFDTSAPLYTFLKRAIALRRGSRVFSRGVPEILREDAAGPGVIAWRMRSGEGSAIVAMNTSSGSALLDNVDTGLAPGTVLRGAFAIGGQPRELVAGADGSITTMLPSRAGLVWLADARARIPAVAKRAAPTLSLDAALDASGIAPGAREVALVIDGDLDGAQRIAVGADGRWRARVSGAAIADAEVEHRLVAYDGDRASPARSFRVAAAWKPLARVDDPAGDERYAYPTAPGWSEHTLDLTAVEVSGSDAALKIDLTLAALSAQWQPPNGFDHLALTLFLEVPGVKSGIRAMPQQRGELPGGMRWNYRMRLGGWSNALFASDGASAGEEGTALPRSPGLRVDRAANRVTLIVPRAALPGVADWHGVKLYVTTWDYDGGYRPLRAQAEANAFGGAHSESDPLVMDHSGVIVLP